MIEIQLSDAGGIVEECQGYSWKPKIQSNPFIHAMGLILFLSFCFAFPYIMHDEYRICCLG